MDPSSFLPILSGMLGGAATAGLFKGPVKTVEDYWYILFGHKADEKAELIRAKKEVNIEAYKHDIVEEVSKIDPKNLKEPDLIILGPALEASKYYIDNETLRKMFAKLISASMDSSRSNGAHPSFVETIKQLSPKEALFLKKFDSPLPIAQIIIIGTKQQKPGGLQLFYDGPKYKGFKNFYADNSFPNWKDNSLIISNLLRLGLIEIENAEISDKSAYLKLKEEIYHHLKQTETIERLTKVNKISDQAYKPYKYESQFGYISLTDYGDSFFNICI